MQVMYTTGMDYSFHSYEELRKYILVSFDIDFQLPNLRFDGIPPQQMSEVLLNPGGMSPNFVF